VTKVQLGEAKCSWCGQDLQPRRGGSPQRFCSAKHRSLFWSALRRWGERAVAAGILTVVDIRNGDATACTLLLGATSAVTPQHLGPVAPFADSQQELERRMAEAVAMRRRG
jgi:hypothetical protein